MCESYLWEWNIIQPILWDNLEYFPNLSRGPKIPNSKHKRSIFKRTILWTQTEPSVTKEDPWPQMTKQSRTKEYEKNRLKYLSDPQTKQEPTSYQYFPKTLKSVALSLSL